MILSGSFFVAARIMCLAFQGSGFAPVVGVEARNW
jgi:hypothetical protein